MVIDTERQLGDEITLDGRRVRLVHERVSPHDVRLDPDNRRVQHVVQRLGPNGDAASIEAKIEEHLLADNDVRKLIRQIRANGGLVESVIITHDGLVIEGNCRTVSYRKLSKDDSDVRWQEMPVRRLPEGITRKQIDVLLGSLHVAGKNPWSAFERAAYIYHMAHDESYSVEFLADHLRMTRSSLTDQMRAYEQFEEYLVNEGATDKDATQKWSYFDEFAKRFKKPRGRGRPVASAGQEAVWWKGPDDLPDRFRSWVTDETKLPEGRAVRDLSKWVEEPTVLATFEQEGFDDAKDEYERLHPEETSVFFKDVRRMILSLQNAPRRDVNALKAKDTERVALVEDLRDELQALLVDVGLV